MYCKRCGTYINDSDNGICPTCGEKEVQNNTSVCNKETLHLWLWGLLGCLVPIAGLVLFLVWNDTKPKIAKAAGIGAIVSTVGSIVISIIIFFVSLISEIIGAVNMSVII